MSAYSFLLMGIVTYMETLFAAVDRRCPINQFLNPTDPRASAIVMAGTSLHTGTLYIAMGQ